VCWEASDCNSLFAATAAATEVIHSVLRYRINENSAPNRIDTY
jgi:hypothetical protein